MERFITKTQRRRTIKNVIVNVDSDEDLDPDDPPQPSAISNTQIQTIIH